MTTVQKPSSRLEWLQPKAGHGEFHLVSGERRLGVLNFRQWGKERLKFTGLSESWEIRTEGFWDPTYHLRESARGIDIASYTARWHGAEGLIQISNGPRFTWKVTGMFTGKYTVSDSAGRVLLRVRLGLESRKARWSDWARTQGTVEVDAGPYDERIVTACLVLAWFLVLLNRDFDGSSSAVNAAVIS